MDATEDVAASSTSMHRTAILFFGPSVISLPLGSTLPTFSSSSSGAFCFPPNSASSMRIRSSLSSGSTGMSASAPAVPHGTTLRSRED